MVWELMITEGNRHDKNAKTFLPQPPDKCLMSLRITLNIV